MDFELSRSFVGETELIREAPAGVPLAGRGDVDLVDMAHRSLNYLIRNPRPELGYACRFTNYMGECPPGPPGEDFIANGDSDCRMDWEYMYMGEMTGSDAAVEVQQGVRRRILGYLGEDGLAKAAGGIWCGGEVRAEQYYVSPWTTAKVLYSLAETFSRTGEASAKTLARKVFLGLKSLAATKGDRAWFPSGCSAYLDGRWYKTFMSVNYAPCTEPVLHYGRLTGDQEALDFAHALARGTVLGLQEGLSDSRVREDGSFADHTHIHTHETWGVADAGAFFGDDELLSWARRVYEFVRGRGGDSGWFPEVMLVPGSRLSTGQSRSPRVMLGETCITSDMVSIATCLARAGEAGYYDHVERYVRNYLREMQFTPTPAFEAWYRRKHAERPRQDVEAGLRMVREDYTGGFMAQTRVNDMLARLDNLPDFILVGCCVPEGMRAIYTAWRHAVVESGDEVRVNLCLDRKTPAVEVTSLLPGGGRVRVVALKGCTLRIRVPGWIQPDQATLSRNGRPAAGIADGGYLVFPDTQRGETFEVSWPQPVFQQRVMVGGGWEDPQPFTFTWRGNTVLSLAPRGEHFPIYPGA